MTSGSRLRLRPLQFGWQANLLEAGGSLKEDMFYFSGEESSKTYAKARQFAQKVGTLGVDGQNKQWARAERILPQPLSFSRNGRGWPTSESGERGECGERSPRPETWHFLFAPAEVSRGFSAC